MKNKIIILALAGCSGFYSLAANAVDPDLFKLNDLVDNIPENTFIPPGFDSNDRAQIVADTCYKQGPTTATVDHKAKKIWINSKVHVYSSCWCLQTTVPFQDTVEIGILKTGKYDIAYVDKKGNKTAANSLTVTAANTNQPDDFLYASVNQIFIDEKNKTLTVNGSNPGSCTEFQEMKVMYRSPNIVEVLPIVKLIDKEKCSDKPRNFETKVQLTPPWTGTSLVYVRSLNGKSVNRVVEF